MIPRMLIAAMSLLASLTSLPGQARLSRLRGVGTVKYSGYAPPGNKIEGLRAVNAWGDIDGDGDLDSCGGPNLFMHTDRTWSLSWVLLNDGAGAMKDASYTYSARVKSVPKVWGTHMLLLLDTDADGDLDQISTHITLVPNSQLENARYLKNDGKGFFSEATTMLNMPRMVTGRVSVIDANKDAAPDLIFTGWFVPSALLLNNGKGAFKPARMPGWGSTQVMDNLVGDYDLDGDEDVISIVYDKKRANTYYLNDGKGFFSTAHKKKFPLPAEPGASGAVGDLDGDGDLDLVFGQDRSDLVMRPDRILWNDGKGNFTMTTLPGIKSGGLGGRPWGTASIQMGDLDGDGDLDLVMGYAGATMASSMTNMTRIYENLGKQRFREFVGAIFEPGLTHQMTLVDFDHDGDLDLLSSKAWYTTPPNHVWMNLTRQVHFREPPQIGRTLLLDVYSARKQVATANFIGLKRSKLALAPMGNWWLAPSTMFYVGSSLFFQQSGKQTLALPIPWNTYLIGLELHAQSLYYDSARRTLRFSNLMREKILP